MGEMWTRCSRALDTLISVLLVCAGSGLTCKRCNGSRQLNGKSWRGLFDLFVNYYHFCHCVFFPPLSELACVEHQRERS